MRSQRRRCWKLLEEEESVALKIRIRLWPLQPLNRSGRHEIAILMGQAITVRYGVVIIAHDKAYGVKKR